MVYSIINSYSIIHVVYSIIKRDLVQYFFMLDAILMFALTNNISIIGSIFFHSWLYNIL